MVFPGIPKEKCGMCDGQFALYNEIWIPSGHLALQWKASVVNHEPYNIYIYIYTPIH